MSLSRASVEVLSDLIANRLSIMSIGDQDDLREQIVLKRALMEMRGETISGPPLMLGDIPRRGRRRKVGALKSA